MVYTVCCVSSCYSTKKDVKLFNFPCNDALRDLWVDYAAPHCPEVLQLLPKQLVQRKICIRHFESRFLVNGNRLYNAFPTLFTAEEIVSGVPREFRGNDFANSSGLDHNYCKRQLLEPETSKPAKIPKLNESSLNQPSTTSSNVIPITNIMINVESDVGKKLQQAPLDQPGVTGDTYCTSEKLTRPRLVTSVKALTPKCRQLYRKCRKIICARKLFGGNINKRIEQAAKLNETNSFQNLLKGMNFIQRKFIEMQFSIGQKKKMARRYNLEEKLLSLALLKQSPKGYSLLQKIFTLPTKRTLHRILRQIPIGSGINEQLFTALKVKVQKWSEAKKLCSIVFDEVQLSPHLDFIPSIDAIHGLIEKNNKPRFADHALVFMARGICGSWRQPIAYYFCEGTIQALVLKNLLQDITKKLIETGLHPLAFICDQGVTNQSALKMLQEQTRAFQLRNNLECDNTILVEKYNLSIIYDPPHLLKGIRNNMLSKDLIFKGKLTKWDDIIDLYNYDCSVGDIRMLPKLTDEHVIPEKIRKMKVSYCAQVLSESVASILRFASSFSSRRDGTTLSTTVEDTAAAVQFFDKLFDSCNGSRNGRRNGKLRGAVKKSSEHLQFWRQSLDILKTIRFADKLNENATKTVPSIKNWITTLESLIRLTDIILSKKGVLFFYTRNFNQDPLENFFGKIRAYNWRNNNPNAFVFQNSFKSILITNMSMHSKYANCENDIGETVLELKNLIAPSILLSEHTHDPEQEEDIQEHVYGPRSFCPSDDAEAGPSGSGIGNESIRLSNVVKEKVKINARTYTAGYVTRRLLKIVKCKECKNSMLSKETLAVHELTTYREWLSLKNRNLLYPNTQLIVAFSQLINIINNLLENHCHKNNIIKNIKNTFIAINDLNWLGCSRHQDILIENFIKITSKIQIFNWCKSINKILSGTVEQKIKSQNMTPIQRMAFEKFCKYRKIKK